MARVVGLTEKDVKAKEQPKKAEAAGQKKPAKKAEK